ncbi:unnamed protein product [Microthlaspi erraticum]|uniref:Uncharacterized protein n=1 Tax=Microthlaspi erraticum TaxID=1685480 RepID=A0A6D2JV31_9BRAS|nr:unnamed protein product [Microthlaspi erraticum]
MKTSMSIIIFFVAVLSISTLSLAKKSPVEACIRRNIAESLSPSPSTNPITSDSELSDDVCRDEGRIITYFLKLNGTFPTYYVKALCKVFGDDEESVKQYVTDKWLNHSEKVLDSLTCITRNILIIKRSPVEACIRSNVARALSPSPSSKPITSVFFDVADEVCRDETRIVMYFLKLNGKFPTYYVRALCHVFGKDEKKVKEYVTNKWLNHSKKVLDSLTCASL